MSSEGNYPDNYIDPDAVDKQFLMAVEDVFSITGRGTVVAGRVERGVIRTGEEIEIIGLRNTLKTTCASIELFRKELPEARAGDNCGVLLRGVSREDVQRGQVLAQPGSIKPYTKFTAEIYLLKKEEGGRQEPLLNGCRLDVFLRTAVVIGVCEFPEGVNQATPGDSIQMTITLVSSLAMERGTRVVVREGGRTIGEGSVLNFIE